MLCYALLSYLEILSHKGDKMKTILIRYVSLGLFAFMLLGCGGGGGSSTPVTPEVNTTQPDVNTTQPDTTVPNVERTSPSDGDTDVELTSNISALFDEAMKASTFTRESVVVRNTLLDVEINGSVSYDSSNKRVRFTPVKPLSLMSEYEAILKESITDLAGNALAEKSWHFSSRDGIWQNAQLLEINNAGHASKPQIAMDASGYAIAVWIQKDGIWYNIWANRFSPESGWGSAEKIESEDTGNAFSPQIAMDASGHAIAVWTQYDGTRYNIWAKRFSPESGWGSAEKIENDTGDARKPQIAMDASGHAIAVWTQDDGTRYNIWANRFSLERGWGSAEKIESDTGGVDSPQIAMDASGHAIAVWTQYDGTGYNIWANRFSPESGWGSAEKIESDTGDAFSPQIAMDASGHAIAVWMQYDSGPDNIWANRFSPESGWDSAEKIESEDTGDARKPQIAMDASGHAIAVWTQDDGTRNNIWANHFSPERGWDSAEKIENDTGDVASPQIAMDTSGHAIAVWTQADSRRVDDIRSNRYDPKSGWGNAEKIESEDAHDAFSPQIAMDASGHAIAVWGQYDGRRDNIWENQFK
jgi:hypothetical protein